MLWWCAYECAGGFSDRRRRCSKRSGENLNVVRKPRATRTKKKKKGRPRLLTPSVGVSNHHKEATATDSLSIRDELLPPTRLVILTLIDVHASMASVMTTYVRSGVSSCIYMITRSTAICTIVYTA